MDPFKRLIPYRRLLMIPSVMISSVMISSVMMTAFMITAMFLSYGNSARADTALREKTACVPPTYLARSWPETDFSKCTIDLGEIISGGPGKDGIPPLDSPQFIPLSEANITDQEPVISLHQNDVAKAYPLSILIWHEIVNDEIAGLPVAVTYCPLCNTSVVFDRRHHGQLLDFGTTGSLRYSDLIMYDRQTSSFWQQYAGNAIAGELAGTKLTIIPSRLESLSQFKDRHPTGQILAIPTNFQRRYGANPYVGYDSSLFPFLFTGTVPDHIPPLERVVVFGDTAMTLSYVRQNAPIIYQDYRLNWQAGQASALDSVQIANGRDVGTVTVQQTQPHGTLQDVPYKVTFAFVWHAFNPDQPIIGLTP